MTPGDAAGAASNEHFARASIERADEATLRTALGAALRLDERELADIRDIREMALRTVEIALQDLGESAAPDPASSAVRFSDRIPHVDDRVASIGPRSWGTT